MCTRREYPIDNFSGAVNFDNTKAVDANAAKFVMGEFMTPGKAQMRKGTSIMIPIRMTWGTLDAPRQVKGTFIMPVGLKIDSLAQNPDVQPNNFNKNNLRCMKTGTNKWQFLSVSNAPNYWKTTGTAPCFYLYVTATDEFTGGVITMTDLETMTQKTGSSSHYNCADATCSVEAIILIIWRSQVQALAGPH